MHARACVWHAVGKIRSLAAGQNNKPCVLRLQLAGQQRGAYAYFLVHAIVSWYSSLGSIADNAAVAAVKLSRNLIRIGAGDRRHKCILILSSNIY